MTARLYVIPFFVAMSALGYFFWTSSTALAPEQAVQAAVLELVGRVEAHDLDGALSWLSPNLEGGEASRTRVVVALRAVFAQPGWRVASLVVEDYRRQGDRVTAYLDVALLDYLPDDDEPPASIATRAVRLARLTVLFAPEGAAYRVRAVSFKRLERR